MREVLVGECLNGKGVKKHIEYLYSFSASELFKHAINLQFLQC